MPSAPRIERASPDGPITMAAQPLRVTALIRWQTGHLSEVQATATAWTRTAVQITWTDPWGNTRSDWIPAADVRRTGQPTTSSAPSTDSAAQRPDRPPRPPSRRRPRW